ncbi:DEAD/DEAH box helicase, partial [Streptomyces xinghaiensis]
MADLLEIMDGERPALVHSQLANAEARIAAFRNTNKRWIVSVAMISEGVDIKRLRVLAYLPSAQTELSFRQAMGRVVRTMGNDDYSRAYVVMPTHRIFEEYARRVEAEMSLKARKEGIKKASKICPACGNSCALTA